MKTKLWVDDERPAPDDTWMVAENSDTAKRFLALQWECLNETYTEVSLDHDLGGDDTSMKIIDFLEEFPHLWPQSVTIHTQNPVGRDNLTRAINANAPQDVDIFLYWW